MADIQADIQAEPAEIETAEIVAEDAAPETAAGLDETPVIEPVEEADGADEAPAEAPALETFEFDPSAADFDERVNATLEKYDFADHPDIAAAIQALRNRPAPENPLAPYEVYGGEENITALLDRQVLLETLSSPNEHGEARPLTNEFLSTIKPETKDWMAWDLSEESSTKYQGLTRFQQMVADYYGEDNEPVGKVLERFHQVNEAMRSGYLPNDRPAFLPQEITEAFYQLSPEERNDLALFDPEYATDEEKTSVSRQIAKLQLMQKGLDADRREVQAVQTAKQEAETQFVREVQSKQTNFYNVLKDKVIAELKGNVQFSADPKINGLLATQQYTLLAEAAWGDPVSLNALKEAGVKFDIDQSLRLQREIEKAATALTYHEKSQNGTYNQVEYNRAKKNFEAATQQWDALATSVIEQLANVTSTEKKEAVKAEAARVKPVLTARNAPKGVGSPAAKTETLPKYGTPQWDAHWAKQALDEQARKTQPYR